MPGGAPVSLAGSLLSPGGQPVSGDLPVLKSALERGMEAVPVLRLTRAEHGDDEAETVAVVVLAAALRRCVERRDGGKRKVARQVRVLQRIKLRPPLQVIGRRRLSDDE